MVRVPDRTVLVAGGSRLGRVSWSPAASGRSAAAAAALTLGVAGASWVVAVRGMAGMGMGVRTGLGSFGFFIVLWPAMMAAMMLPGAVPAVLRGVRADGRMRVAAVFVGSYLAVWALVGLTVYGVYRPHGTMTAGAVVIAAGVYELTPVEAYFRRRCREGVGAGASAGIRYGLCCVGSSTGLMLTLLAVGVMSLPWMSVVALLVLAQKLLPSKLAVDVPLALAIVGLGLVIVIAPSSVPGLIPSM